MFREMRRMKQQVSEEVCRQILKQKMRGVLAVNGEDGYPYALPIDYYYDDLQNQIYFHCAAEGHKIDALEKSDRVSFCLYDQGRQEPGDWALYITSVIIFGRIRIVNDTEEAKVYLQAIGRKYIPSEEEKQLDYDRQIKRTKILSLSVEHMTGKLVHEK